MLVPGMIAGAAGIIGAGLVTERTDVSAGDATLITSLPGWSSFYWLMVMGIAQVNNGRFVLGSTLAAGDVGIVGGALLAQHVEMSRGRGRLVNLGGVLGGLLGGAVIALANIDSPQPAFGIVMAGTTAGLASAWKLTSGYDAPDVAGAQFQFGPTVIGGARPVRAFGVRCAFWD